MMTSPDTNMVLCPAHVSSVSSHQGLSEIQLDSFVNHEHLICNLDFSNNVLQSVPADLYTYLTSLSSLTLSHNQLQTLPLGISKCVSLRSLDLSFNKLTSLPDDFVDLVKTLQVLDISSNPLFMLPACIFSSTALQELYASQTGIKELPDVFSEHSQLTVLHLADNAICRLPPSFTNLSQLVDLDLAGVKWIESHDSKVTVTSPGFSAFLYANPLLERIEKKVCNYNVCCQIFILILPLATDAYTEV